MKIFIHNAQDQLGETLNAAGRRVVSLVRAWSPVAACFLAQGLMSNGVLADTTGTLGTVTNGATSILSTVNAILQPVSLVAIIFCGLAAAFGRMEWGTVAKVGAGILIANSATTILGWFSSGTTASS